YVETAWMFYHSAFRESVGDIRKRVPTLKNFVCIDAECDGDLALVELATRGAHFGEMEWGDAQGNPHRLMGLVPTGGTTGPAKGVCVTNLAWGTMIEMASHYWRCEGTDPVCLSVAPLSHAAGVVAFALFPQGATNVVMQAFDASEVLRNIERHRVTHL